MGDPHRGLNRPKPSRTDRLSRVNHALGRSRGGLTTKIHALADAACDLVALRLTPGQAGDNPRLLGLLDDWLAGGDAPDARGDRTVGRQSVLASLDPP